MAVSFIAAFTIRGAQRGGSDVNASHGKPFRETLCGDAPHRAQLWSMPEP